VPNVNAPYGFQQAQGLGASPTYEQVQEKIASTTAPIFWGDPVFRLADSTMAGPTTGPGPGAAVMAGIFQGCSYMSVANKRKVWSNYWPAADVQAGSTSDCWITNDPNARFRVQAGNSTTVGFVQADIGMNAQFGYGTGNPANGLSGAYIDMAVARAVTATLPFRVIALILDPPGGPGTQSGAYNWAIVGFNNVETKSLTAQA
jgi:peptidoglycan hydrolase-like protein with peptidoglycan-binding domain